MREMVLVNRQSIDVKEYEGKRVVTFKDVDNVHDRPTGTTRKAFHRNKNRFLCGVDYFVLQRDEAQQYGYTAPNGLIFLTESGYLMIAKIFDDSLAWNVQRELVNNYFNQVQSVSQPTTNYTYNNRPVVTIRQIAEHLRISVQTTQNRFRLHKNEFTYGTEYEILYGCNMEQFKAQNAGFSGISKLTVFTPKGARRMLELCKQCQQVKAIPAADKNAKDSAKKQELTDVMNRRLIAIHTLVDMVTHSKNPQDTYCFAKTLDMLILSMYAKTLKLEEICQAK